MNYIMLINKNTTNSHNVYKYIDIIYSTMKAHNITDI